MMQRYYTILWILYVRGMSPSWKESKLQAKDEQMLRWSLVEERVENKHLPEDNKKQLLAACLGLHPSCRKHDSPVA